MSMAISINEYKIEINKACLSFGCGSAGNGPVAYSRPCQVAQAADSAASTFTCLTAHTLNA